VRSFWVVIESRAWTILQFPSNQPLDIRLNPNLGVQAHRSSLFSLPLSLISPTGIGAQSDLESFDVGCQQFNGLFVHL
jgi:hypothetical protein